MSIPSSATHKLHLRPATTNDIPALNEMIALSVRTLHASFYPPEIIESAIKYVYVVDEKMVLDGTFFVIVALPLESALLEGNGQVDTEGERSDVTEEKDDVKKEEGKGEIVTAGAYSFRSTTNGESRLLNPETEAAKLKAMYVHPAFTRLGLGNRMLEHCENEVRKRGFKRLEFGATWAGVRFYENAGYEVLMGREGKGGDGRWDIGMGDGRVLELVLMGREL